MTNQGLTIRPVRPDDKEIWRRLWTGYLDYYETSLPDDVYRTTFTRLLSGQPGEFRGFLAELNGVPVGLVHFLFHPSSWRAEGVCYLQDLFTLPEVRGRGVAQALITAVYAAADAEGVPSVYWFTQDFNAVARRLYDRIGVLTPFIRYNRRIAEPVPLPGGVAVRPVGAQDEADWRRLWGEYLAFYETALPEEITSSTFAQILSGDSTAMQARLLTVNGCTAGLVQFVTHRSCWKTENVCYLQDLYLDPALRGRGLGRALIGAVYAEADRIGTPAVYWLTAGTNSTARQLYDRVGMLTPFVEYDRPG
jgi:GNAT superfamily N-acetyltransferase